MLCEDSIGSDMIESFMWVTHSTSYMSVASPVNSSYLFLIAHLSHIPPLSYLGTRAIHTLNS